MGGARPHDSRAAQSAKHSEHGEEKGRQREKGEVWRWPSTPTQLRRLQRGCTGSTANLQVSLFHCAGTTLSVLSEFRVKKTPYCNTKRRLKTLKTETTDRKKKYFYSVHCAYCIPVCMCILFTQSCFCFFHYKHTHAHTRTHTHTELWVKHSPVRLS